MATNRDAAALWQRYQDWLYYHPQLQLFVDVSRMSFDDDWVANLQPKLEQAFRDVAALEAGAIANPDENRMVGHYWLRAPDLAPTPDLRELICSTQQSIDSFARQVHQGEIRPPDAPKFTDLLLIGIGGSALGPQFVADALAPLLPPMQLHVMDNTDPAGIDRLLASLKDHLASTLVIVTSKSGRTLETRNGLLETRVVYEQYGLNFAQHAVAVTGVDSPLEQIARSEGWLAVFPVPDWVGGRTSEFSAVGLLPAALQGIDIDALLDGARVMDEATRLPSLNRNPAALLALSWYWAGNGRGDRDMVILPYKDRLSLFSRYLQQLVMESLGKEKDGLGRTVHQGIAVYGNKGSTDQHAYVQQLREGVPNFFVTFIEVLEDRQGPSIEVESGVTSGDCLFGFLQGTRRALYEKQRDSMTITIPQVTPRTVGALIALYERSVSLYASLIHINAYHQPGVEAGKQAAADVLTLQRRILHVLHTAVYPLSLAELAIRVEQPDEIELIYAIVRHLWANQQGIVVTGDWGKPSSLVITGREL